MFALRCFCAFALLLISGPVVLAVDLKKIDRTIAKEPKYQTKAPKYCLLVFGAEAKTRVWLVQDGATLYVDRNGNGDLTEPGEKVEAQAGDGTDPTQNIYTFEAGDILEDKRSHKNLRLYVWKIDHLKDRYEDIAAVLKSHPGFRARRVVLEVDQPGFQGTGEGGRLIQLAGSSDLHGYLHFGDRPANAPIIHFGGPWHILINRHTIWTLGCEESVMFGLGTPGLGAGTNSLIGYEGVIPEDVHPRADVIFQSSEAGAAPIKQIIELKERC